MDYFERYKRNCSFVQSKYRFGTEDTDKIFRTLLSIYLAIEWAMKATRAAKEFDDEHFHEEEEALVKAGGKNPHLSKSPPPSHPHTDIIEQVERKEGSMSSKKGYSATSEDYEDTMENSGGQSRRSVLPSVH